tara:strand:- start:376 stop:597 length:222 start_codon:yes stop_codon:yes gene_type:complete
MAITRYSGDRLIGLSTDTKPTLANNAVEKGTTFLEYNTDKLFQWDGDSWNQVIAVTAETGASESFAIAMAVAL